METYNVRSCSCQADLCIGALHNIQDPYFCEDKFVVYPDKSAQICKSAFLEIIESEPYTGFPEACRLFCSERAFTVLGIKYFNSTTQSLVEKINEICIQGVENNQMFSMYQYCILVYIALKGHIKSESVKDNFAGNAFFRNLFETIFEVENVKLKKTCTERALAVMEETMLEKILRTNPKTNKHIVVNNKQYDWEFKHETICEAVQMSFGMKCPKLLLDFCDLDFIVENILPSTNEYDTSDQPLKIYIPQDLVIERMKNILSKGREVINRLYPNSDEYCGFDSSSEREIGVYIRKIAKNNNNDLFLKRFFEVIPVNTLQKYQICDLFDGLTNNGKDKMVICYNPGKFDRYIWKYCKRDVILALCRPTTSNLNTSEFIVVGDKSLLIRLFKFIDSIDIDHEHEVIKISAFLLMVGMGEGNHGFVKSFFTLLAAKIKEGNTSSSMIRILIDGLTDEGKREEILPSYFDFFTHHLLQYGSLIVLLSLCTFRGEPNDEDMTCIVAERRPFIEYASERFFCCLGGYQLKENFSLEKQMEAIGRELYSFVMRIRNKTITFDLLQSFVDSYNSAFVITKEECQLAPLLMALKSKNYAELISFYDGFTDFGKHLDELTEIYPLFIKTFEKATKLYKPFVAFTTRFINLLVEKDDTSNVESN